MKTKKKKKKPAATRRVSLEMSVLIDCAVALGRTRDADVVERALVYFAHRFLPPHRLASVSRKIAGIA